MEGRFDAAGNRPLPVRAAALCLRQAAVLLPHPHFPQFAARLLRHPAWFGSGAAVVAGIAAYWLSRPRLTPDEREAARRDRLAAMGRLVDGTIVDALPSECDANVILYAYEIGGISYERGQDVSRLREHTATLEIDCPVQVRYDPGNPADSIVVAESWTGLWRCGKR